MKGVHKRHGSVIKQDWPIPIAVLHKVNELLEGNWGRATGCRELKRIAEIGTRFTNGFCSGLREEEMLLIEYAGTSKSLRYHKAAPTPYQLLVLLGRTKGNQLSGAKLFLPIAARTEGTNIQPGKWLKLLLDCLKLEKKRGGRLFKQRLIPTMLGEYKEDFLCILKWVQDCTGLIDKEINLREKAGIYRTLKRGASDHLINMGVDETLIKSINRWPHKQRAMNGRMGSKRDMFEHYSSLSALTPTLIRFSLQL